MSGHQIFALIIGIDEYLCPTIDNLRGAAADADAINNWLQNDLKVNKARIINLRNHEANREAIIQNFRKLRNAKVIQTDDPIFIYFAGHGSEMDSPPGWHAGRDKIEAIVPFDTHTVSLYGEVVHPIPDRTICGLLNALAYRKGNNITVVFDCCHSASATREGTASDSECLERRVELNLSLPADIDEDIIESHARHIITPKAFLQRDLSSHVLLAACGAEERAREMNGRGRFTTKFLEAIKATDLDKLTYTKFIQTLPSIPFQNPQCEGYHKERFIFNGKVPGRNPVFIPIIFDGDTYKLNAGVAQGILQGSEFTIHADPTIIPQNNPVLCRMGIIQEPKMFCATLDQLCDTPSAFPEFFYALQVRYAKEQALKVHCTRALMDVLDDGVVRRATDGEFNGEIGFFLTEENEADFIMDIHRVGDDVMVRFFISHPLTNTHGLKQLPYYVPLKDEYISRVLRLVAAWNWNLKRTNDVNEQVSLMFTRVEKTQGPFSRGQWNSIGDNLNEADVVRLHFVPTDHFGVAIVNNTDPPRDLFVYVFWFDSDQRIKPLYRGATGRDRVDPSLRAGQSFTIGYGAPGVAPLRFFLHEKEQLDVGFVKVFITTEPADFSHLGQQSPFKDRFRHVIDDVEDLDDTNTEAWGTLMTTVIVDRN